MHHRPIWVVILSRRFYSSDMYLQDNEPRSLADVKRRARSMWGNQAIHREVVVEEVTVVQEAHNLSRYCQHSFALLEAAPL